jgi:hypothetical protein
MQMKLDDNNKIVNYVFRSRDLYQTGSHFHREQVKVVFVVFVLHRDIQISLQTQGRV